MEYIVSLETWHVIEASANKIMQLPPGSSRVNGSDSSFAPVLERSNERVVSRKPKSRTASAPAQAPVSFCKRSIIYEPSAFDILCGKDKTYDQHKGNHLFREIICEYTAKYHEAQSKPKRMQMTKDIVQILRSKFNCRFIRLVTDSMNTYWEEISDTQARDKISHALRYARSSTIGNEILSYEGGGSSTSTSIANNYYNTSINSRSSVDSSVVETDKRLLDTVSDSSSFFHDDHPPQSANQTDSFEDESSDTSLSENECAIFTGLMLGDEEESEENGEISPDIATSIRNLPYEGKPELPSEIKFHNTFRSDELNEVLNDQSGNYDWLNEKLDENDWDEVSSMTIRK